MGPWSFADLLRDDVDCWIGRMKHEAKEHGRTLPGEVFRERLARRIGVTVRQLDRYCDGTTMPDAEKLAVICKEIGSCRAVKHMARECGVGVYDLFAPGEAALPNQVAQTAKVLHDVGQACTAVTGIEMTASPLSPEQYRGINLEIEKAIGALEGLRGMLRTHMEESLRR